MTNLFSAYSTLTNITDSTQIPVVDPSTGQTKTTTFASIKTAIGALGATGSTGPVGSTGPTGQNGLNGVNGGTGATGATGPTGGLGATGPRGATGSGGPRGADGTSVKIVGSVATSSSLPVPYSGSVGDGYVVADTAHLWFWNGFSWVDAGNIQGPQGTTGAQGPQGATGFGATGPQGATGATGPIGSTGATGPQGIQGATGIGATGPIGTTVPATTATIGGLIVGHNLSVTTSGVVSSVGSAIGDNPPVVGAVDGDHWWDSEIGRGFVYYQGNWVEYSPQSLPGTATTASLGLVQIGSGINLNNGIISVQGGFGATGATGPSGSNGQNGATGATGAKGEPGLVWRGAWDPQGSYTSDTDVVSYNGSSYVKISGNGNSGSSPDLDTIRWAPVALKGADGSSGVGGSGFQLSSSTVYVTLKSDGSITLPNSGLIDFNFPYTRLKNTATGVPTGAQIGSPDDQNYVNVDNTAVTIQVNSDGVTGPHALPQHNWIFGQDGTIVSETGRNITGELSGQTDNGNYFSNQPIAIKNLSGYKRLLGVTNSAQTWLNLTDVGTQLGINPVWIMGMVIDYQAQSSNFSGGSLASMVGQIIIASSNLSSRDISVTHSEAVCLTGNNTVPVFSALDLWHANGYALQAIRTDTNSQQLDIIWTAKVFINASEDYC